MLFLGILAVNVQCTSDATQCSVMRCTLSVLMHVSCDRYAQQTACGLLVGLLAAGHTGCCAHSYNNAHTSGFSLTPAVWSVLVRFCAAASTAKKNHMYVVMWCRNGKVTVSHVGSGEYEVQDVRCRKCSTRLDLKASNEVHQRLCIWHCLVVATLQQ